MYPLIPSLGSKSHCARDFMTINWVQITRFWDKTRLVPPGSIDYHSRHEEASCFGNYHWGLSYYTWVCLTKVNTLQTTPSKQPFFRVNDEKHGQAIKWWGSQFSDKPAIALAENLLVSGRLYETKLWIFQCPKKIIGLKIWI